MVFFFFQAEDGIRDFHVTGVQTCALPISPRRSRAVLSRGNNGWGNAASHRPWAPLFTGSAAANGETETRTQPASVLPSFKIKASPARTFRGGSSSQTAVCGDLRCSAEVFQRSFTPGTSKPFE